MNNFDIIVGYIVRDIIGFIMNDRNIKMDVAMDKFYSSQTFDKLHDKETGLYLNGPAYVYEFFKEELNA